MTVGEYNHPNPYTARLNRYAPLKGNQATQAQEFIRDMLEVTGGGRARDYEGIRDHAIIRVFTEGVRRAELAKLQVEDLLADLTARPFGPTHHERPHVAIHSESAFGSGRIGL